MKKGGPVQLSAERVSSPTENHTWKQLDFRNPTRHPHKGMNIKDIVSEKFQNIYSCKLSNYIFHFPLENLVL